MRTFVLIAGVFALLVGLFVGYTMWQTGDLPIVEQRPAPPPPITGRGGGGDSLVGATERPWVTQYDANWQPTSQFRAASFEPESGDRVRVTDAEARFFLAGGELIRVRGDSGTVVMSRLPEAGQDPRQLGPAAPPSRGALKNVEIELYDSAADLEADVPGHDTSVLRVTLDNAAFDNESFRIYTDDSTIDGQRVPANEIPVHVTGRDYEFEGQGLTIRWNELDRRLELLRVYKGRRLVVKNPEALDRGILRQERSSRATPLPVMLAATDASAAGEAIADAVGRKPAYRASFRENLRIVRGGVELLRGDEMFIDFTLAGGEDEEGAAVDAASPTTVPAGAPTTAPAIAPTTTAATQPATATAHAATQPVADAGAVPASQPLPLIIYWDGELLIQPLAEQAPMPASGSATIHVVGSPVRITEGDSEVNCAALLYDSERRMLTLDGNDEVPLSMRGGNGADLKGRSATYVLDERVVVFRGRTVARMPMRSTDGAAQALLAEWSDRCTLRLAGETGDAGQIDGDALAGLRVEHADMVGNVRIVHPSLKLQSNRLQLTLEADAEDADQMLLRELTASGEVNCVISDEPANPRAIAAERVHVVTAVDDARELYPREIRADGQVVATDAGQRFAAEHLVAKLKPAVAADEDLSEDAAKERSPEVELEHLVAMGGAEYIAADGRTAAADQITAARDGVGWIVTLLGDARLGNGDNTLRGPHVQAVTKDQLVKVLGGGSIQAVREVSDEEAPRPITAEWTEGVVVDGVANRVDVTGDVVLTSSDADGTSHAITGAAMRMNLEDAPPQADDAGPGAAKEEDGAQFMADKVVREVVFAGGVEVHSLKTAATGEIVRRLKLQDAERLTYDVEARQMMVPTSGRLLFQDHPQLLDVPATQPAGKAPDRIAMNGNTAMQWKKQLVYDEPKGEIELQGDVRIVHESDRPGRQGTFDLRAQTVTAELARDPGPDNAADAEDEADEPELRRLIARDAVEFVARGIRMECSRIEYEPQTGWLTASGTDANPVNVREHVSAGLFGEARYNLHTQQVQVKDFRGNIRR